MDIMQFLKNTYVNNEPIFLKEIQISGMTEVNIRQSLKRLVDCGQLERFCQGIYYIPEMTPFGKSKLSAKKVIEKKYIRDIDFIYGFYTGIALENEIGLTTQVPNIIEIVTNNESSRIREITIGSQKVRLRSPNVKIDAQNARILQFLDLMTRLDMDGFSDENLSRLIEYVKRLGLNKMEVFNYAVSYPSKTSKNMIESGIIYEFA